MTTAEILRAAKAHLIECGWCQGDELSIYGPPGGRCCAVTAMSPFTGDLFGPNGMVPWKLFRRANDITGNIADWNDAPARTLEDVLAAYDKAIIAADLKITADELRAMPMPQAVVAFLRACRTFDEVGDIDGPWKDQADRFLCEAAGVPDIAAYLAWERSVGDVLNPDVVFDIYDKAIAAAEQQG